MWADVVVVLPPGLDDGASLGAAAEPLHAEALVAELAVEALVGPVLPGLSGVDERRIDTLGRQPPQDGVRDELRSVVGTKVPWRAVHTHKARHYVDDAPGTDAPGDVNGQTFAGVLVHDGQALELLAVGAAVEDEVVGPHVVRALRG
jgi:hypothetical protein